MIYRYVIYIHKWPYTQWLTRQLEFLSVLWLRVVSVAQTYKVFHPLLLTYKGISWSCFLMQWLEINFNRNNHECHLQISEQRPTMTSGWLWYFPSLLIIVHFDYCYQLAVVAYQVILEANGLIWCICYQWDYMVGSCSESNCFLMGLSQLSVSLLCP